MMDDSISRRAAIEIIMGQPSEPHYPSWYAEQLKELPSVQSEIVMCADCQKYIDYRCRDEHANLNDWRHEDDYCSFGKRREVIG